MKNTRNELIERLKSNRLATAVDLDIAGIAVKVLKPTQDALSTAFAIARNIAEKEMQAASVEGQTLDGIKADKGALDLLMAQIEDSGFKGDSVLAAAGLPSVPKTAKDIFLIQTFLKHMGRYYALSALHDVNGEPLCKNAVEYADLSHLLTAENMAQINEAIRAAGAKN